jgi:glyoxylase-like metal-dependent hydrolase (beta-lactamase superfamily II)
VIVETFPAGPLGCNCSIVVDPATKRAVVIDPGGDLDLIRERLDALGATVSSIVHTHTHVDHVGATAPLQRLTGATASIHEGDRFLYDLLPVQSAMIGVPSVEKAEIEGDLVDGRAVTAGGVELGVLHTPGHTPGSVCFSLKTAEGLVVFAGDTLFQRSIGRTDLWGGDGDAILRSIKGKLLALDDGTKVITGHGPSTTIGAERRANPFLRRLG